MNQQFCSFSDKLNSALDMNHEWEKYEKFTWEEYKSDVQNDKSDIQIIF